MIRDDENGLLESLLVRGWGRIRLRLRVLRMGEDLVVLLDGGDRPHVGGVGLSGSGVDTGCAIPPHKEEPLARGLAEKIAAVTGAHVAVVCGIHLPAITPEEINHVLALAAQLVDAWIAEYRGNANQ